jgi:hypothetical protein
MKFSDYAFFLYLSTRPIQSQDVSVFDFILKIIALDQASSVIREVAERALATMNATATAQIAQPHDALVLFGCTTESYSHRQYPLGKRYKAHNQSKQWRSFSLGKFWLTRCTKPAFLNNSSVL